MSKNIAPRITKRPTLKQDDNGNKLLIECEIEAAPKPEIKWFKENVELKNTDKCKAKVTANKDLHTINLEINNLTSDDSGVYKVVAKNSLGEVSASITLNFAAETAQKDVANGIAPNFIEKPQIKSDSDGKRLCFECKIKADPEPILTWSRDGEPIADKGRYLIYCDNLGNNLFHACLEIDDVNASDAGKYTVNAKNALGESNAAIALNFETEANQASTGKPTLIGQPVIRQLEQKIIMEVKVSADPLPTFAWECNGVAIKDPKKFKSRVISEGNIHTVVLEIQNATLKDSGTYSMIAKNKFGEARSNIELKIQGERNERIPVGTLPHLVTKPTVTQTAQLITIVFEIKSNPSPSINWMKDAKELSELGDRFVTRVERNGTDVFKITLEIKDPKNTDAGVYKCVLENELGEFTLNINLTIQKNQANLAKTDIVPPTLVEKPTVTKVDKNLKIEVKIHAKPDLQTQWFKGKEALKANPKKYKVETKKENDIFKITLEILDYNPTDSGLYKIQAKNDAGQSNSLIFIDVAFEDKAPRFMGAPKIVKENGGKLIVIEIDCECEKAPAGTWTFGDKAVPNEGRFFQEVIGVKPKLFKFVLEIDSVTPADAGTYKLNAKTDSGEATTSVDVKLDEPKKAPAGTAPTFAEKPKDQTASDGDKVTVTCKVKGTNVEIKWLKGTRTIENSKDFTIEISGENAKLVINDAYVDDTGDYSVEASNDVGKQSASFKITIKEKKGKPKRKRPSVVEEPKKKVSVDNSKAALSMPKQDSYDEEGPRRAPKPAGDDSSSGPGSRKVSQPAIKLDVIDEFGAEKHEEHFEDSPSRKDSSMEGNRRPSLRKVDTPDKDKNLKARRDSQTRRASLAEVIPDWPTLHTVKRPTKEPEKFVKPLEDIHAKEEDGEVRFSCTFCKANGKLRWYKQKSEIFHGLKYHFNNDGASSTLIITKLHPDDSGKYVCKINDIETFAYLTVDPAKPKYEFLKKLPVKMEVFRTKQTTLECFVNHEDCFPKWYKNGVLISPEDKRYRVSKEKLSGRCSLRINKNVKEDEGEYTCAIDDAEKTSCLLYVEEPEFRFTKRLPQQYVGQEDQNIEMECEIEDEHAECEWYQNGKLIDAREKPDKYEAYRDGLKRKLLIKKLDPKTDADKYECRCGVAVSSSQLFIKENLKFVKHLADVDALEESHFELIAEVNKSDQLAKWFKNGREVRPSEPAFDRFQIVTEGNIHKLVINKVDMKDTGEYECKFLNLSEKCKVTAKECEKVPRIDWDKVPKKIKVKAGKDATIEVPYESWPIPLASWRKNGNPLDNKKAKESNENKLAALKIEKASRSDSGKYELVLNNSKGETIVPIELEIIDKPAAPKGPLKVSDVTSQSVVLAWEPPEDDGGSPILNYIVEKMDASRAAWNLVDSVPASMTSMKANKLTAGKEYQFRVRAVNSEGEGPNLETTETTLAKNPYDEPSSTSAPEILDWTPEAMEITWQPPTSDGGAPIEKYVIERRSKGTEWKRTAEVGPDQLKATVKNLSEGKEYEFRVIAVNKAGPGKPSEPSRAQIAKHRFAKPKIDVHSVKSVTVKSGQPAGFDVLFTAEPMPTGVWSIKGEEFKEDDVRKISISEKVVKLSFTTTKRSDTGKYNIKLTNSSGSDAADCELVVLAAPSKPKGPLVVKDVRRDNLVLTWQRPEDDGGRPITGFVIEKRDRNSPSDKWEKVTDQCQETSFNVGKLKEDHEYEFRVMAESPLGTSEPLVTETPTLAKSPFVVPDCPREVDCASRSENHIELMWKPPSSDGGAPIRGYVVERKEKKSDKWIKASKDLVRGCKFFDDKVHPRREYEYRVSAVNEEGQGLPGAAANPIPAKPEKEKPKFLTEDIIKDIKVKAGEKVHFNFPMHGTPIPKVTVKKSGIYADLPREDVQFIAEEDNLVLDIPSAAREHTGNYEIRLENAEGSDSLPIKITVIDKPAMCEGPIEVVDSSKTSLTLAWKPPKSDGGLDVTNYTIEKQLEGSEIWQKCNVLCTQPRTTIKGLDEGKKYNFRVCAVNILGASEPLESAKSFTVKPPYDPPQAPEQPEIVDYSSDYIRIKWKKPENDGGNPVSGYLIEMKAKSGIHWLPCNNLPLRGTEFTATGLTEGETYELRVRAANDAGVSEPSKPTKPQVAEPLVVLATGVDTPKVESVTKESILISWKKPKEDGGAPIQAYVLEKKRIDDKNWEEVVEIPGKESTFMLKDVKEGEECQLRMRAKNSAGVSEPSKPTDLIKCEDQPEAPSIDLGAAKDVTVNAGQNFELHIPFRAHPKPTCEWTVNDHDIVVDDKNRVVFLLLDNVVTIVNMNAKRSDSGLYKLTLRNRLGTHSTTIRVNVIDIPEKPEGPLEVADLDAESCTLKWKAPKDDGGNEVFNYVVEKRAVGTEKWIKAAVNCPDTQCPIKNLDDGVQYEFRVHAENIHGLSEPLTCEPITAKWPFRPPGAPGEPTCLDRSENSITIKWAKPQSDGGDPVTTYVIEKKEKGTDKWVGVTHAGEKILSAQYTIRGLTNGHAYDFRVAAVNRAGAGKFAETTEPIVARPSDCAPSVSGFNYNKEVVVRAGELLKISVPYYASPVPDVLWSRNGEDVFANDRNKVNVSDMAIDLSISNAQLKDGGFYTCSLRNPFGKDSVEIKVIVLDRPGQPEGPLEVSDVTADTCVLKWNPPKEDGGSPVNHYIIEKQDVNTKQWQKVSTYCRNTQYEILDLLENHTYKFRVSAENEYGVSDALESTGTTVAKNPFKAPDAPAGLNIASSTPNSVTLEWKPVAGKQVVYMPEYYDPELGSWVPGTESTVPDNSARIVGLKPGINYNFRVKAKNVAGWGEPSRNEVSITLKAAQATLPEQPAKPVIRKIGRKYVELEWKPVEATKDNKILGYIVEKKQPYMSAWVRVNRFPLNETELFISDLSENELYEFRISAVNKAGESEPSESTGMVKVSEYPDGTVPEIKVPLKDQEFGLTREGKFEVQYEGNPAPAARWFKNGFEIYNGVRFQISDDGSTSILKIRELVESDNNNLIECFVVNPIGKATSSAVLRVKAAPKLDRDVEDQFAELGDYVKVKFALLGKGPYNFTIKKDDEAVTDERIKVAENEGIVTLSFSPAQREDTGKYNVLIENESGSCNAVFKLKVRAPPSQPQEPFEATSVRKTKCFLSWVAPKDDGGSKISHYVIEKKDCTKGDMVFSAISETPKEPFVNVKGLTEDHEYEFRVTAVNDIGTSEPLNMSKKVVMKLSFTPPSAPNEPVVTEVGSNYATISWSKPDSDGGDAISGYYVERKEKESERWIKCNINAVAALSVTVTGLVEGNEYEFRVIAENEAGLSAPSANTKLTKIRDPNASSLEFKKKLENSEVIEGRSVTLECEVADESSFSVHWFKSGKELFDCGKHNISQDGNKYKLTINNANIDDEDDYVVKIKNKAGMISSRASLSVRFPPKIKLPQRYQQKVIVQKGETVNLKVPFNGNPRPSGHWSKNDAPLDEAGQYYVEFLNTYATLTIKNADMSDSGDYKLTMSNELGTESVTISIQVQNVPDAPHSVQVEENSFQYVRVGWQPPANNGGSEIKHYLIEKAATQSLFNPSNANQTWTYCGITHTNSYQMTSFLSDTEYTFRIVAENEHGISKPSEHVTFTTVKDAENQKNRRFAKEDQNAKKNFNVPSDYDNCFHDIWSKGAPKPIDFKYGSVHDYYEILEEIGRGAFGIVYRAIEKATGKTFAAKFVPVQGPVEKATVKRECEAMNNNIHGNLLNLHDVFEDVDLFVMITEFLSGGELFEKIAEPNFVMTEEEAKVVIRQICEGLRHMHENSYVHLDLKPENVLFQSRASSKIKLVDFGLASKLDPDEEVKVSSATLEFSAPEILEHDSIGYYTDMWAVGVLTYVLLSGISPFAGATDAETEANIKACDLKFATPQFNEISDNCKDFLRKIIMKQKAGRLTVHDALNHPWLAGDSKNDSFRIPSSAYDALRQRIRAKFAAWPLPPVSIGRIANFSSLRKHYPADYSIYSTFFDRREAAPRFIVKPRNTVAIEGTTAEFRAVVIAASAPLINWYRDGNEIKQSFKHIKKYNGNSYVLEIKRSASEDQGEYQIKASNSYGERECLAFLSVERLPREVVADKQENKPTKRVAQEMEFDLWREADLKATFTFLLRPRLIQEGVGVKFLCCLSGKPVPKVAWYKDGNEISDVDPHFNMEYEHGVCTLEIKSCYVKDSGKFTCKAENALGADETACQLVVEECKYKEKKEKKASNAQKITFPVKKDEIIEEPAVKQVPKPRFTKQLDSSVLTTIDDTIILEVDFEDGSSVNWTKNKQKIVDERPRTKLVNSVRGSRYFINSVKADDEGEYTCEISNSSGSASTTCRVNIKKEAPKPAPAPVVVEAPKPAPAPAPKPEPAPAPAPVVEAPKPEPKPAPAPAPAPVVEAPKPAPKPEPKPEPKPAPVVEAPKPAPKPEPKPEPKPAPAPVVEAPKPAPKPEPKPEPNPAPAPVVEAPKPEPKPEPAPAPAPAVEEEPEEIKPEDIKTIEVDYTKPSEPVVVEEKAAAKATAKRFGFNTNLKSQSLTEGEIMHLECDAFGDDPLSVVWLRNNKEIPENPDFLRERDGNLFKLTVNEIFPEDSGVFSAVLINQATNETKISSCSIIVKATDEDDFDPKFLTFPESKHVEEGASVKFECKIAGSDAIKVKLNKDGNEVSASSRIDIGFDSASGVCTLHIHAALVTDDGQYEIVASNKKGEIIAAFNLNVDLVEN